MEHPTINESACIGSPDARLVEAVLAIVQLKQGEAMTEEEVIVFAKSKLPSTRCRAGSFLTTC